LKAEAMSWIFFIFPYIKPEPKTNTYRLVVSVNNITPVKRFILGLQKDVEVLSGEGLFVF
jgi:hypothetical protein